MSDPRTNDQILADVKALLDSIPADAPRPNVLHVGKLERVEGLPGIPRDVLRRHALRLLRAWRDPRPRRSRQIRSPRRRQELRQWARLTGGRLAVKPGALARLPIAGLDLRRGAPASLGPATVADAQAFTTWLATRRRWGLVPDAAPMREQPSELRGPFPTPERWGTVLDEFTFTWR